MFVSPQGNVGIGTLDPAGKLHVAGGNTVLSGGSLYLDNTRVILWKDAAGVYRNAMFRWLDNTTYLDGNQFQFRVNDLAGLQNALHISPAGNVGIGSAASTKRLHVQGGVDVIGDIDTPDTIAVGNYLLVGPRGTPIPGPITVAPGKGGVFADFFSPYSSKRWKENIETVDDALELVGQLRGIYYNRIGGTKRELGMIAEEVGEVLPELVTFEEDGKTAISLNYSQLTALLVEAIKELQAETEELRAERAERDERIDELASGLAEVRELLVLRTKPARDGE